MLQFLVKRDIFYIQLFPNSRTFTELHRGSGCRKEFRARLSPSSVVTCVEHTGTTSSGDPREQLGHCAVTVAGHTHKAGTCTIIEIIFP